jgi:hypothetical protein
VHQRDNEADVIPIASVKSEAVSTA